MIGDSSFPELPRFQFSEWGRRNAVTLPATSGLVVCRHLGISFWETTPWSLETWKLPDWSHFEQNRLSWRIHWNGQGQFIIFHILYIYWLISPVWEMSQVHKMTWLFGWVFTGKSHLKWAVWPIFGFWKRITQSFSRSLICRHGTLDFPDMLAPKQWVYHASNNFEGKCFCDFKMEPNRYT